VRDGETEREPVEVPVGAKQAGEAPDCWSWVEPSIWTARMLAALAGHGLLSLVAAHAQAAGPR